MLVVTPQNSALWKATENISQAYRIDPNNSNDNDGITRNFVKHSIEQNGEYNIPLEYSEKYLSEVFLRNILGIIN